MDEHLAFALKAGRRGPHLLIENLDTGRTKSTRLSWVEGAKDLQIKGHSETHAYSAETVVESLSKMVEQAMSHTVLRRRLWGMYRLFGECILCPRLIPSLDRLRVLGEDKRDSLWLQVRERPEQEEAWLVPCFGLMEEERRAIARQMEDQGPPLGEAIATTREQDPLALLRKRGIVASLTAAASDRWYRPIMLTALAGLFCMSDFSGSGENALAEALWMPLLGDGEELSRDAVQDAGDALFRGIRLYVRHFPVLAASTVSFEPEAQETLKEKGYTRKERFRAGATYLNSRKTEITRFEGGGEEVVLCSFLPRRSPPDDDVVMSFPQSVFADAVQVDACRSIEDSRLTAQNLLNALAVERWLAVAESVFHPVVPRLRMQA
ncbi:MAG: hypothetical protein K9L28_02745 [Synergistales bacterium]|nr:hypothetical protein [Synergistales bacterium]